MSKDGKASYYDAGGIETIEIIKAKLTQEQYKGFLLGNIIKYTCRSNFKGCQERDIEKAKIYLGLLDNVLKTEKQSENDIVDAEFDDKKNDSRCKTSYWQEIDRIRSLLTSEQKKAVLHSDDFSAWVIRSNYVIENEIPEHMINEYIKSED